jgi:cadmium resistance protein CadD (predicted permease)
MFARAPEQLAVYVVTLLCLTLAMYVAAHRIAASAWLARHTRRLAQRLAPFVMMALGIRILAGASALLK